MFNQKWGIVTFFTSLLAFTFVLILHTELEKTSTHLKRVHDEHLDVYQTIEKITFYNIERANAIRGLLSYEDRRFLENYYALEQEVKQIKTRVQEIEFMPILLIDLLKRDDAWVAQADLVLQVYESGDIGTAKQLAEGMTPQREVLLEDLMRLKDLQFKKITQDVANANMKIDALQKSSLIVLALYAVINLFVLIRFFRQPKH